MGTNYYAYNTGIAHDCPHCGHINVVDRLLIGKSSVGHPFVFADHKNVDTSSFIRWMSILSRPGVIIKDEYGDVHPLDALLTMIFTKRITTTPALRRFTFQKASSLDTSW